MDSSPDGALLVTASRDGTSRVWRMAGGRPVGEPLVLEGHSEQLWHAEFSPDGRRIVTTSNDRTARVWTLSPDGSALKDSKVLRGHLSSVWRASFSADGRHVLTTSSDKTARVWSTETLSETAVLEGAAGIVIAARISADGRRIVTSSYDGAARVYALDEEMRLEGGPLVLKHGEGRVHAVDFNADATKVAAAKDDGVFVWTIGEGPREGDRSPAAPPPAILSGHNLGVLDLRFSPDGRTILSGSTDRTLRLWDANNVVPPLVFRGHVDAVFRVRFGPDGHTAASASDDGTVRIWDLRNTPPHTLAGVEETVPMCGLDRGVRVATIGRDGSEHVWSLEVLRSGSRTRSALLFSTPKGTRSANVALSRDGAMLATGGTDGVVRVFDVREGGREVILPVPFKGVVNHIEFGRYSSTQLVAAGRDGSARVWLAEDSFTGDAKPRTFILRPKERSQLMVDASISVDGRYALAVPRYGKAEVYDLRDAAAGMQPGEVRTPEPHATFANALDTAPFSCAAEGPEGRLFVLGTGGRGGVEDSGVMLYDVKNPARVRTFRGHTAQVYRARLSVDGRMIVTGSKDQTARVWRVDKPDEPVVFDGHGGIVYDAGFSPDGTSIVTASSDGNIRIWPVAGGDPIVLLGASESARRAWFSPDGQYVHALNSEGQIQTWRLGSRFGAADLVRRLRTRTTTCVSVDLEVAAVGRTREQAEEIHAECERSFGRSGLPEDEALQFTGYNGSVR